MKLRRITAALLVAIMICFAFASCGSLKSTNVHVTFIDANGETIGDTHVDVTGTKSNPPTVLQAAQEALVYLDFEEGYEITNDGHSIKAVKGIVENDSTDAENGYYQYWRATVNGNDSSSGRQDQTTVYSNDEVVYTFVSDSRPREDIKGYDADTGAND